MPSSSRHAAANSAPGAEVELDEACLGLVRDVGGGGFQGDGIADAPGCRHAFLKRNRKLLVIYGDPEMAQQAGGKRVGQYARTGVEFRSQFGGSMEGVGESFRG